MAYFLQQFFSPEFPPGVPNWKTPKALGALLTESYLQRFGSSHSGDSLFCIEMLPCWSQSVGNGVKFCLAEHSKSLCQYKFIKHWYVVQRIIQIHFIYPVKLKENWRKSMILSAAKIKSLCLLFYPHISFFLFVLFWFVFLRQGLSLHSVLCPRTHYEEQAGLELRPTPLSLYTTTPSLPVSYTSREHLQQSQWY